MKPAETLLCLGIPDSYGTRMWKEPMSFDGIVKVHFLSPQSVPDSFARKSLKSFEEQNKYILLYVCACVFYPPLNSLSIFFDLSEAKKTTHLLVYVIPMFVEASMLVIICVPLKLTRTQTQTAVFESPGTNFLLQLTYCRWYKPWGICPFTKVMRLSVLLFTDLWLSVLFLVSS